MGYNHFVTGNFKSHEWWMSEEEFAKVLDSIVIACVDCVIVNSNGEMLLGKRTREPQPDWWIIGGRMKPGESFNESASRNIRRELSLDIDPSRFDHLNTCSLVWERRAQHPQENGCHTVAITMVLNIEDYEIENINPDSEYEELKWINPKNVDSSMHPAVAQHAADLLAHFAKQ